MELVLEDIHGNSKVSSLGGWSLQGKQITVLARSYSASREGFTELYNFFSQALGHSVDVHTLETLKLRLPVAWTYQIDSKYSNHRFFVKDKTDLTLFLLKYGERLTSWTR